jgi:predicted small secreted protein
MRVSTRLVSGVTVGALCLLLGACNTFGGIGKDLAEAGSAVEKSANWSQDKINNANAQMSGQR